MRNSGKSHLVHIPYGQYRDDDHRKNAPHFTRFGDSRESENFHMIFHMPDHICEYFDSEARETLLECVFVNPDQKTNNLIF